MHMQGPIYPSHNFLPPKYRHGGGGQGELYKGWVNLPQLMEGRERELPKRHLDLTEAKLERGLLSSWSVACSCPISFEASAYVSPPDTPE